MTNSNIAAAIAAAQGAAADLAASQAQAGALATQATGGTAVGAPISGGAPLGLDDMMGGGVSVDHWLKISEYGLTIGNETKPLDTLEVFLDLAEVAYCYSVKYSQNGTAVYHKTYDRMLDAKGGTWAETLRKAQQIDAKAFEYRSAEIPMTLSADVLAKDGKSNAAKAGDRVGLTLSTTAWRQFEGFLRDLKRANVDAKNSVVKLTLGFETKQKAGVKDWGIPTFKAFEEVDAVPLFETVH